MKTRDSHGPCCLSSHWARMVVSQRPSCSSSHHSAVGRICLPRSLHHGPPMAGLPVTGPRCHDATQYSPVLPAHCTANMFHLAMSIMKAEPHNLPQSTTESSRVPDSSQALVAKAYLTPTPHCTHLQHNIIRSRERRSNMHTRGVTFTIRPRPFLCYPSPTHHCPSALPQLPPLPAIEELLFNTGPSGIDGRYRTSCSPHCISPARSRPR